MKHCHSCHGQPHFLSVCTVAINVLVKKSDQLNQYDNCLVLMTCRQTAKWSAGNLSWRLPCPVGTIYRAESGQGQKVDTFKYRFMKFVRNPSHITRTFHINCVMVRNTWLMHIGIHCACSSETGSLMPILQLNRILINAISKLYQHTVE